MRKRKLHIISMIAALAVCCLPAFSACAEAADSGTCGAGLQWELSDDGTLTISGQGEMYNYDYDTQAPWSGLFIERVIISEGVTGIGANAFMECDSVTDIDLPDSLARIGEDAFDHCDSLTSIRLPDRVTDIERSAFYGCRSLTDIRLPEGLTNIGEHMFYGCGLKEIKVPDSVTNIEAGAFTNCVDLESVRLPEGLTSIEGDMFYNCRSLKTIKLPDSVTSIEHDAFGACSSLTDIQLPAGLTSIGDSAFYACDSLTNISLPSGLEEINDRAFYNCRHLTEIEIPDSVFWINNQALGYYYYYDESTDTDKVLKISNFTITGAGDSVAENYANENGFTFIKKSGAAAKTWTVTFKNGSKTVDTQKVEDGGAALAPKLTKAGHTLSWSASFDNVTQDMTVKAVWTPRKYTVTFKNGTATAKTQKVAYGKAALAPKLKKEGYKLSWSASFKKITKNLTVKAVWKPYLVEKGYTTTKNGLKYKVTKSSAAKGTVQLAGVSDKKKTSYTVPESVAIGKYKFKVTGIAAKAFYGCSKAKTISLPKTVASVGKNAFAKVPAKLKITVPKAQYKKISKLIKKSGISKKIAVKKR